MNKYHFVLSINFKCDYDVEALENIIKIKPYKIIKYEDSKDNEAKFIYKSEIMDNIYTDNKFRDFVKQVYPKLQILKSVLKQDKVNCLFKVVFDELNEKPCTGLRKEVVDMLSELSASFEIKLKN